MVAFRPWRALVLFGVTVLVTTALFAVPARGEGKAVNGVINLNTATVETLSLLPGIGPSKARAIVAYRTRRPFRTVDELVRIRGIGRRMVRGMRAHLAVAGPSTVRAEAGRGRPEGGCPVPLVPPPPRPPVSPVVLRPMAVALARGQPLRPVRGPVPRPVRSPANHCMPPP